MEKEFFTELGKLLKKYNIEITGNYMKESVFRYYHEDHCGDTLLDK